MYDGASSYGGRGSFDYLGAGIEVGGVGAGAGAGDSSGFGGFGFGGSNPSSGLGLGLGLGLQGSSSMLSLPSNAGGGGTDSFMAYHPDHSQTTFRQSALGSNWTLVYPHGAASAPHTSPPLHEVAGRPRPRPPSNNSSYFPDQWHYSLPQAHLHPHAPPPPHPQVPAPTHAPLHPDRSSYVFDFSNEWRASIPFIYPGEASPPTATSPPTAAASITATPQRSTYLELPDTATPLFPDQVKISSLDPGPGPALSMIDYQSSSYPGEAAYHGNGNDDGKVSPKSAAPESVRGKRDRTISMGSLAFPEPFSANTNASFNPIHSASFDLTRSNRYDTSPSPNAGYDYTPSISPNREMAGLAQPFPYHDGTGSRGGYGDSQANGTGTGNANVHVHAAPLHHPYYASSQASLAPHPHPSRPNIDISTPNLSTSHSGGVPFPIHPRSLAPAPAPAPAAAPPAPAPSTSPPRPSKSSSRSRIVSLKSPPPRSPGSGASPTTPSKLRYSSTPDLLAPAPPPLTRAMTTGASASASASGGHGWEGATPSFHTSLDLNRWTASHRTFLAPPNAGQTATARASSPSVSESAFAY